LTRLRPRGGEKCAKQRSLAANTYDEVGKEKQLKAKQMHDDIRNYTISYLLFVKFNYRTSPPTGPLEQQGVT
jgi:hypothetical protein